MGCEVGGFFCVSFGWGLGLIYLFCGGCIGMEFFLEFLLLRLVDWYCLLL